MKKAERVEEGMGMGKEVEMTAATALPQVTAQGLLSLLAQKHESDLFVPECKDGPSYGRRRGIDKGTHVRLDALAINRSWANACVYGYEIKVSRSDFVGDQKWPAYLPCCNCFSFVCPSGLIQPNEVGDQAGLLWASKTGGRLYTKKKPPYREATELETLFRYVLICRSAIVDERTRDMGNDAEYWRWWVQQKKQNTELGYRVARRIREIIERDIKVVGRENARLKREIEQYEDLKVEVEKLGLGGGYGGLASRVRQRIEEAEGIPYGVVQAARQASDAVARSLGLIEKLAAERKREEI